MTVRGKRTRPSRAGQPGSGAKRGHIRPRDDTPATHLLAMIDSFDDAILCVDTEFRLTCFNKKYFDVFKATFGVNVRVGDSFVDSLPDEQTRERAKETLDRVLRDRETIVIEDSTEDPILLPRMSRVTYSPIADSAGEVSGVMVISRDITEQKELEQRNTATELEFKAFLMAGSDAFYIASMYDGKIIDVNQGFESVFRYSREEVVGKTSKELDLWADYAARKRMVDDLERYGQSNFEIVIRRKDGELRECIISTKVFVVRNAKYIVGIVHDISERKRAERSLAESQSLLNAIVDSTDDLMWTVDAESFGILWFNRSFHDYFLTRSGIRVEKGMLPKDLFSTNDLVQKWCSFFKRTLDEDSFSTVYAAYGGVAVFLVNLQVLKKDDKVFGISVFGKDITERNKIEKALKDSEEKYRALVENANEAVIVAQDGMIKFVNSKTAHMAGYTYDELTAMPFVQLIHPDDVDMVTKRHSERLSGQNPTSAYEFRIISKNGEIRWVEINAAVIAWEGRPATLNVLADITERKIAEEAMRQSEIKYRTLFNSAEEAIFVMDDGGFVDCNLGALRMFRCAKAQIVGTQPYDLSPELQPDGMPSKAKAQRFVESTLQGRPQFFEWKHTRHDGTDFDAEVSLNLVDVTDKKFLLATVRDVTERKRTELALSESNTRFRAAFMTGPIAYVIVARDDGRLVEVNDRFLELYGYSRDEVIGRTSLELGMWADLEVRSHLLAELQSRGQVENLEVKARRKSGEAFWVLYSVIELKMGGLPLILGAIQDITEQKRSRDQLVAAYDNLKRAFSDAIDTMSKIVEMRDPYTAGHQRRVASLAMAIGREMGVKAERIEQLTMAAMIHDIGKIHIAAEILSKPGRLTDLESQLMKTHAESGYEVVRNMQFPPEVGQAILQHHERLDGSGYPKGLKGEDVILEARILSVADVVEAMASHRPYRPALGLEKALEEISKNRGILYDSQVVDACLNLFEQGRFNFDSK